MTALEPEALQAIKQAICGRIVTRSLPRATVISLPWSHDGYHLLEIYVQKKEDGYIVTDGGNLFGALYERGYKPNDQRLRASRVAESIKREAANRGISTGPPDHEELWVRVANKDELAVKAYELGTILLAGYHKVHDLDLTIDEDEFTPLRDEVWSKLAPYHGLLRQDYPLVTGLRVHLYAPQTQLVAGVVGPARVDARVTPHSARTQLWPLYRTRAYFSENPAGGPREMVIIAADEFAGGDAVQGAAVELHAQVVRAGNVATELPPLIVGPTQL